MFGFLRDCRVRAKVIARAIALELGLRTLVDSAACELSLLEQIVGSVTVEAVSE